MGWGFLGKIGSAISNVAGGIAKKVSHVVDAGISIGRKVSGVAHSIAHKVGEVAHKVGDVAHTVAGYVDKGAAALSGIPILGTAAGLVSKVTHGVEAGARGVEGVSHAVEKGTGAIDRGIDRAEELKHKAGAVLSTADVALRKGDIKGVVAGAKQLVGVGKEGVSAVKQTAGEVGGAAREGLERVKEVRHAGQEVLGHKGKKTAKPAFKG
jgi:hypothetical protein